VPKDIMQISRDPFPFCNLRQVLDLFMSQPKLHVGTLLGRQMDIRYADNCHYRQNIGPHPNSRVQQPAFYSDDGQKSAHDYVGGLGLKSKTGQSSSVDEKSKNARIYRGEHASEDHDAREGPLRKPASS
jgi:hypothetical protein